MGGRPGKIYRGCWWCGRRYCGGLAGVQLVWCRVTHLVGGGVGVYVDDSVLILLDPVGATCNMDSALCLGSN